MRHAIKWISVTGLLFVAAVASAALKPGDFVTSGSPAEKRIALTFDDGPGPNTAKFLDLLDRYKVKATFFMLSEQVRIRPKIAQLVLERGHEIANHTSRHTNYKVRLKQLKKESPELAVEQAQKELVEDMQTSREVIEVVIGKKLSFLRMPHGIDGPWIHEAAKEAGFILVNWTYGADWTSPPPDPIESLKKSYVKALRPGTIYLLHDGWPKSAQSLAITEALIKAAKDQEYKIVTVGELLGK